MGKLIGDREFDTASHCVFRLTYHVVWCMKFRRHLLNSAHLSHLATILPETCKSVNCRLVEFNGEDDHVHLLVETPPTSKLSDVVGYLKSKTASAVLTKFGSFFYGKHSRTIWGSGYFVASTGGVTLDTLQEYVRSQSPPNPP
jgi:putative transposase